MRLASPGEASCLCFRIFDCEVDDCFSTCSLVLLSCLLIMLTAVTVRAEL